MITFFEQVALAITKKVANTNVIKISQKYNNFRSILQGDFIKHKPLVSKEWSSGFKGQRFLGKIHIEALC